MKIGILGSGAVGQQLGLGFSRLGHEVKIGTRDPKKLQEWLAQAGPRGSAGSFEEAAKFGELVALAKAWGWPEPVDMGGIGQAIWLESLAMAWIAYAFNLLRN